MIKNKLEDYTLGSLFCPFKEKFGLFLLRFLNSNLSSYENAYKDFFYAYGFEILKNIDTDYTFILPTEFNGNEEFVKSTSQIFYDLQDKLIEIQNELKNAVNYIYNIDNIEELKPYTSAERYAVYLIKRQGALYTYAKNDNVIKDSYANKYEDFMQYSDMYILESLKNQTMFISMQDTHKSNDLSAICYAILEELSKTANNPIKKCQNCGMYFIPNSRLDEIYCDYPKSNGKTCREQGAMLSYNSRLKQKTPYTEYRKIYQQKFALAQKDKSTKKDFDNWKKEAKEMMKKFKHKEISTIQIYNWLEFSK